jgi:hypothetical protein
MCQVCLNAKAEYVSILQHDNISQYFSEPRKTVLAVKRLKIDLSISVKAIRRLQRMLIFRVEKNRYNKHLYTATSSQLKNLLEANKEDKLIPYKLKEDI